MPKLSFPHLENLLIQDPGAEHGDAIGQDRRSLTPEERFADLLFAVHDDGDGLLFDADGHSVPPEVNTKRKVFAYMKLLVQQRFKSVFNFAAYDECNKQGFLAAYCHSLYIRWKTRSS